MKVFFSRIIVIPLTIFNEPLYLFSLLSSFPAEVPETEGKSEKAGEEEQEEGQIAIFLYTEKNLRLLIRLIRWTTNDRTIN